ncbi:porin family protein [Sphingobacterium bovistauri]|uniref:PorT family protein n=1 Tax=Sphingobacterium bovistauri TaxID=2781959 RepID=A0ABS7Z2W4_9SPHI|nr:porin family protein [Sphingobacterium bovistauri]MCA5004471.1 PorT family protein [Sphingobacterium bovistauri]
MKKVLLSLGAALLMAAGAQAQTSYGIKAGVNLSKFSNTDNAENNVGFHITGFADMPIAPNFSIQPGLSLQNKGSKHSGGISGGGTTASIEGKFSTMSVEIPVNFVYYVPAGNSGSLFLGAGPYAGYNISGKYKVSGNIGENGGDIEEDIDFTGDDKDMKAFDAGVNFLAGYKLANGFLINAGYGLGLTNLSPSDKTDDKISNRVLSFGVGFQF